MSKLHDYSLVEMSAGSYSLHTCVHDWTLGCLNHDLDCEIYQIAVHCVAEECEMGDGRGLLGDESSTASTRAADLSTIE